jgi:integrase
MSLPEAVRSALPISAGVSGVLSRYGDIVWDLTPFIHPRNITSGEKKIVYSSLKFDDGSCLTDLRHAGLLASTKAYLYTRIAFKSPTSGKKLSARTLINKWSSLRPLLRWMAAKGYASFAGLTSVDCLAYVVQCENTATIENNFSGSKGRELSKSCLLQRYMAIEDLWHFREHLSDTLTEHPWPGNSAHSLAGFSMFKDNKGKTELIPERLMKHLVQGALRYVESSYGEKLLDCRAARCSGQPIKNHLTQLGLKNWSATSKEITRLLTACYVVIDAFSGMRDSEMASLETGCYHEHEGWDGAIYGWLRGTAYKMKEDPEPAEWMVPPIVGKAIRLAEHAVAPLRTELLAQIVAMETKMEKTCYLNDSLYKADIEIQHEMKKQCQGLFLGKTVSTGKIRIISNISINLRLKEFAEYLDLRVQAPDLAQLRYKERIRVGDFWSLSCHQFRKTFAVYVARCILGDVRYLREHFKHWSLDMTLYYAISDYAHIEDSLFDEILTEREELQAIIIDGWIDVNKDQPMAGLGGEKIKSYRQRKEARLAKDPNDLARKLSKGLYLRGLGHSWCTEKECKGLGIYDVLECKECENRVIDRSHLSVWRGIRNQQIEILDMADLGDPMWQRAVDHLRYAEDILHDLGDDVEPFPIPPIPSERRCTSWAN